MKKTGGPSAATNLGSPTAWGHEAEAAAVEWLVERWLVAKNGLHGRRSAHRGLLLVVDRERLIA
jgi:hypothetical protein